MVEGTSQSEQSAPPEAQKSPEQERYDLQEKLSQTLDQIPQFSEAWAKAEAAGEHAVLITLPDIGDVSVNRIEHQQLPSVDQLDQQTRRPTPGNEPRIIRALNVRVGTYKPKRAFFRASQDVSFETQFTMENNPRLVSSVLTVETAVPDEPGDFDTYTDDAPAMDAAKQLVTRLQQHTAPTAPATSPS